MIRVELKFGFFVIGDIFNFDNESVEWFFVVFVIDLYDLFKNYISLYFLCVYIYYLFGYNSE